MNSPSLISTPARSTAALSLAALSLAAVLAGCTRSPAAARSPEAASASDAASAPRAARPPEAAAPIHKVRPLPEILGKPQAPVIIESVVDGAVAHVTVRFPQGGAGVDVQASGAEGLTVKGAETLASNRNVASGEALAFDVPFTPGEGESLLAVRVKGNFGGAHRAAVRAFPVGARSALQKGKDREGTATVGGENVRIVPAVETQR
jgi:hypothetical protein